MVLKKPIPNAQSFPGSQREMYNLSFCLNLTAFFLVFLNALKSIIGLLSWISGPYVYKNKTSLGQKLSSYKWYHVIPTGLGVSVFLYWSWKFKEKNEEGIAKKWEITCYKAVPLRSFSRAFGWVSEREMPPSLRPAVYSAFSRVFNVNVDEMASPFDSYNCMSSFFCRPLKEGSRPIGHESLVSPADGTVLNSGRLTSFKVEQIKGVTYSLQHFLGQLSWLSKGETLMMTSGKSELKDSNNNYTKDAINENDWEDYKKLLLTDPVKNDLFQCIVYLAPGDYHRFHSPAKMKLKFRRHFEGELFSVKPIIAKWIPDLFSLNERALYVGDWEHGFFSMTAVGATNVGSIKIHKDEKLHTNEKFRFKEGREFDLKLNFCWEKGEEIGEFRLGSTIVMIFEAPKNFVFTDGPGSVVRVGKGLICQSGVGKNAIS